MERRLIVMRHAQSASGNSDHERPLTKRGREDAATIAEKLVVLGWTPQLVISSDARRTRQTWEVMKSAFDPAPPAKFEKSLYLAGIIAVENALFSLADDITDVLFLGHNPGWQHVVGHFSGRQEQMTPATAALLHGTGDTWQDAATSGNFELVQLLRPGSN